MQIKCSLDIGAWFDILSIYNVKINSCTGEKHIKNTENFVALSKEIKDQIGISLYNKIIESEFYKKLYDVNLKIFNLVDRVKKEPNLGKEIDDQVYERYIAKTSLQKHFFQSELKEIKSGYEK